MDTIYYIGLGAGLRYYITEMGEYSLLISVIIASRILGSTSPFPANANNLLFTSYSNKYAIYLRKYRNVQLLHCWLQH